MNRMRNELAAKATVRLRVRYAETDQMGRAHHMHHLAWFEFGRTELMRRNGISYAALEREGVFLPVARVAVEYRGAAGYDDEVVVTTRVGEVRSRSVTFLYEARAAGDGALLSTGSTQLVCTDEGGRPSRIPAPVEDVLRRLFAAGQSPVGGEDS